MGKGNHPYGWPYFRLVLNIITYPDGIEFGISHETTVYVDLVV